MLIDTQHKLLKHFVIVYMYNTHGIRKYDRDVIRQSKRGKPLIPLQKILFYGMVGQI